MSPSAAEPLGTRLRRLRRAAKKTLQDVADDAGLTVGFLSQAERGLTGVSLSSLANIARALQVPLNQLFEAPPQTAPDSHAGERPRYQLDGQQQTYERLSSVFPGSQLDATKMSVPPGFQSETVAHEGDEFVYVLKGQVRWCVAERDYVLGAGDSLHFDARHAHSMRNIGDEVAELVSVTTLRIFSDTAAMP